MSSIIIYITDSNKFGSRKLPLAFEDYWKEGDEIETEDGSEKCKIIKIVPDTSEYRTYYTNLFTELIEREKQIERKTTPSVLNISFSSRSDLNEILKKLRQQISTEIGATYLRTNNLKIENFTVKNIVKCFSNLKINEHKINCKVVKMNATNTLTFDLITKYMGCEIESIDLKFSILDKYYTYKIEDNKILLKKRGVDYTLKIIHIDSNDIIDRLPRYMNEKRKKENI